MSTPSEPDGRARIRDIVADLLADWPGPASTEVVPGLWQGGTDDDWPHGIPLLPDGRFVFDVVVTLFEDAPPVPEDVEEFRWHINDADLLDEDIPHLRRIAEAAHERWTEGSSVLVRCQAGINRSGLMTALIIMQDGITAKAAIQAVREARGPMALSNPSFEYWLLCFAGPPSD